eukprot:TRINITY_DN11271_c0_g1_i1.p1 TRINITY_DN11271_c0_g1~~TRINITY_DN11271_c0_g1_i1.p1  ORF type:complete len:864 (-),score=147.75 TRINITY_DN11271_c0_g1_i1:169-2760(-)
MARWAAILSLLAVCVRGELADSTILKWSKDRSSDFCGDASDIDVDREKGSKDLEAIVGKENVILTSMKKSKSSDDFGTHLGNELTFGWFIGKAWPILMCMLCFVVWFFCCWTICPCCKRCRVMSAQRVTDKKKKLGAIVLFCLLGLGLALASGFAFGGFGNMSSGMVLLSCDSANLVKDILGGTAQKPGFVGVIPAVATFERLVMALERNPKSEFLTKLGNVMDGTKSVDEYVNLAAGTVGLLKDMMKYKDNQINNVYPKIPTNNVNLMHKCQMCEAMVAPLTKVEDILNNGVGKALQNVRAEVNLQLTGAKLVDLQANLKKSIQPLRDFKKAVKSSFGWFVDPDGFSTYQKQVQGVGSALFNAVMVVTAVLVGILACGGASLGCFVVRERNPSAEEKGLNPYSKMVNRSAACTWCCGWFYAVIVFLVGGLMIMLAVPLGSMCQIMEKVDANLIEDIGGFLGFQDPKTESEEMVTKMIDRCMSVNGAQQAMLNNVSRNLGDIIVMDSAGPGSAKATLNTQVGKKAIAPIEGQFSQLTAKMNSGSGKKLSTQPELVSLRELLKTHPITAMILPEADKLKNDPNFKNLALDSKTQAGFATSVQCADFTVSNSLIKDQFPGPIPGITSFWDKLKTMGTPSAASALANCADKSLTSCSGSGSAKSACDAGNSYLTTLKKQIVDNSRYQCDVFQNPSNPSLPCDPKNMKKVNGKWTNTCVPADGKLKRFGRRCTLVDFKTYVQEFDVRFGNVFQALDDEVAASSSKVQVDLKTTVDKFLIKPIRGVMNLLNCGFLTTFFKGLIDGMCYKSVVGFDQIAKSYVACAFVSILLVLLMYIIWRRHIDNINHWHPVACGYTEEYKPGGQVYM